jgi:hypothetical protein
MTDIEFDEIDRAVSSALEPSPKEDMAAAQTDNVASPAPSNLEQTERPIAPRPAPAARRTGGRFMDVVHSSSSMKPRDKKPEPFKDAQPSRPIEPPKPVERPSATGYPDPIDFQNRMNENRRGDGAADQKDELTDDAPMGSPFLSDAKVEKRPLGAYSNVAEEARSNDHPIGSDTPLPEELQDDLLSIETNQALAETPVSGQEEPDVLPSEATKTAPETTEPSPEETTPTQPESTPAPKDEPAPPVPSIVQQYQEKQSSAPSESGAIFDTEQYHQPLAHTPKKKSGWLVVLWIFILIIVGGGLGAAAYYFVLPEFL